MNRREASKSETRRLILSAARKLFLKKGVEQCTMRAIAKEAGVSAASVVVHFKNKTALLEVALYEDIGRTIAQATASPPRKKDLLSRIMQVSKALFAFYDSHRNLYRTLVRSTVFEPAAENPHLTKQLEQHLQFFAELIEHEKTQGNVFPDVDAKIASMSLSSLYFGVLTLFFRSPEMTAPMAVELLTAMTQQYLTGIMCRGRRNDGST